jgi:hypothetical protein
VKDGPASSLSVYPARIAIMRHIIPEDLFDFVLIGAGVLILCVLFAHSPFTDRPRHPMLFGILSAGRLSCCPFSVIDAGRASKLAPCYA